MEPEFEPRDPEDRISLSAPFRIHKVIKYKEKDGEGVAQGKVLKKDLKANKYLVYILQGRNRGNRTWVERERVVEESFIRTPVKESVMPDLNINRELKKIDNMISEELALKYPPETGKTVSGSGSINVGDQISFVNPANKRHLVGIVREKDEKEFVASVNSDFSDYAMGWYGQPMRIPYGEMSKWQVKKIS